ncbi:MAG: hypothetical protein ACI9EZ_000183 [Halobacteriales archaeon]|jgi:hypothetical protein
MDRREYLLGAVGVVGSGLGAYYVLDRDGGHDRIEPTTIEVFRETGRTEIRLPAAEGLTVVDLFSTYCSGCDEQIASLEPIHLDASGAVSIVSLTTQHVGDEFTVSDLRTWWDRNGGPWPVGVDDGTVAGAIGVEELPTVAVLDPEGTIHWTGSSVSTGELRERLQRARSTADAEE